jgi:diguanylate cyclase (GGDEF)-like protein
MRISDKEVTPELADRIYAEQVSLLYTGSIFRPALHFISLAVFLINILDHVNFYYAYTWALLLITINAYRFVDAYKTNKYLINITNFKGPHIRYAICTCLLGLNYGLGFVFFFDYLPLINHVYLMTTLSVLVIAGIVSFSSDKVSFYLYFYSVTFPVIIRLLLVGEIEYYNFAISVIIFMLIVRKFFIWNYDVLTNAIRLKIENEQLSSHLQVINEQLTKLSVIDELTQLGNRRSLDMTLDNEWKRSKRNVASISMLMIDIDYFKQYNDKYGHIKGDECLQHISTFLKDSLTRSGDFLARYGGEEFCIIMPDTNLKGAIIFAEKIHSGIRELEIPNPDSEVSKFLTVSIGVSSAIPKATQSYMDLIYTSDKALYIAKKEGRNIIRSIDILVKNPESQIVV